MLRPYRLCMVWFIRRLFFVLISLQLNKIRFALRTFRLQDVSLTELFAHWTFRPAPVSLCGRNNVYRLFHRFPSAHKKCRPSAANCELLIEFYVAYLCIFCLLIAHYDHKPVRTLSWAWTVNNTYKNLAIANRSRVSCADTALRASIGLNITPWPWNLG